MTFSLTTRTMTAIETKNGKVSKTATRALDAMNGTSEAVRLHIAIHGKGVGQKTAATAYESKGLAHFVTLESLPSCDWPNVYALLGVEFGFKTDRKPSKAEGGYKAAIAAILQSSRLDMLAKDAAAQSLYKDQKAVDRFSAKLSSLDSWIATVGAWIAIDAEAVEAAKLAKLAGLTDAPSETPSETPSDSMA